MFGTPEAGYIGLAYATPCGTRTDNLVDVGVINAAGEELLPLQIALAGTGKSTPQPITAPSTAERSTESAGDAAGEGAGKGRKGKEPAQIARDNGDVGWQG